MNRLLLILAAAGFALMLAMPFNTEAKARTAGSQAGSTAEQSTDLSSRRRWRHRHWGYRHAYWGHRHWGYRRAYWGRRYAYWAPRRAYWGPRYYGYRRAYWGPRYAYWGPRYYWRPRPVFWGPRYYSRRPYWGGPAISIGFGFGPRWGW